MKLSQPTHEIFIVGGRFKLIFFSQLILLLYLIYY